MYNHLLMAKWFGDIDWEYDFPHFKFYTLLVMLLSRFHTCRLLSLTARRACFLLVNRWTSKPS